MRQSIRFIRNGQMVELDNVAPTMLLLDYLREVEGATGTKEGCGEGDCGACTVALGTAAQRRARLRAGQCLHPAPRPGRRRGSGHGRGSRRPDGTLHPVQAAMVENHGSQCGFCTPGFVMSLFALYHATSGKVRREEVNDWIAGNLCRCTGYRPIVDAGACRLRRDAQGPLPRRGRATRPACSASLPTPRTSSSATTTASSPRRRASTASPTSTSAIPTRPSSPARPMSGCGSPSSSATCRRSFTSAASRGLDRIEDTGYELIVGATATYAAGRAAISRALDPDLGELLRRLGSKQVRATGTVGGNIANGSPIGDTPPALIALGATVELRKGKRVRTMPLEEFFIDYGKQDRVPGELVTGLVDPQARGRPRLPLLQDVQALRPGHLGGDGRLPLHRRRGRAITEARDRLRRHGGDAEAGASAPRRRCAARCCAIRAPGRAPSRRSARTFSRSTTIAPRRATGPRRRTRCSARR